MSDRPRATARDTPTGLPALEARVTELNSQIGGLRAALDQVEAETKVAITSTAMLTITVMLALGAVLMINRRVNKLPLTVVS